MVPSEVVEGASGVLSERADWRRRPLAAACALVVLALFAWNVQRHWFLSDDGFISFRCARNLAEKCVSH